MADTSDRCEELLEEYRVLRRQVAEDEYTNPDIDEDDNEMDIETDKERIEELREILEEECDIDVAEEDDDIEADLDLPEYAAEAPSEPMDFEQE